MKIALVCIARDEDDYLLEWLDYNLKIGFDDIFIYQNNWRTKHAFQCKNIHLLEFDGQKQQVNAYNQFIDLHFNEYDWIAFFDIDEFLNIKNFQSVHQWLELKQYENIGAIGVNWRLFGNSNLDFNGSYNVIERFTYCRNRLECGIKCIIHTAITHNVVKFTINPHCLNYYIADPNLRYLLKGVGQNDNISEKDNDMIVELNHYFTKTFDEFHKRKFMKELPDQNGIRHEYMSIEALRNQFNAWNYNDVTNLDVLQKYKQLSSK